MRKILFRLVFSIAAAVSFAGQIDKSQIVLPLRCRVQPFKGTDVWDAVTVKDSFPLAGSAIVVCDMWDRHWCTGATNRVAEIARRMNPLLNQARAAGILVIHAPSETMDFYKDYPQRKLAMNAPKADPPAEVKLSDPPLPIDDSDGGCENPNEHEHIAWKCENALLSIGPNDAISADGHEIYNLLHARGIHTLFVMGVHANMCILNRSFAIRQMTRWGIRCVLVRDLTDAMYNPKSRPYVDHVAGTNLVIEHIEKYWCPSTLSSDLIAALGRVPAHRSAMLQ